MASFAKFREMQKTILRKIFRENRVRKTAKMVTADFDPFQAQNGAKRGLFLALDIKCTNLFDAKIVINSEFEW